MHFKLNALIENGFTQSVSDNSLYVKDSGDTFIALLVYVDDIVITGNSNGEIDKVKQFLKTKFQIKDLRELKYFLGIEVLKNEKGMCISQRKYCLDLLDEYGLLGCKPASTPIKPNLSVLSEPSEKDPLLTNLTEYQQLVGKLIYLTLTRPDISFSVQVLSQFMHAPLQSHFNLALRVLRYLKGSPGKGVQFVKSNNWSLNAYCDADYGKCKVDRKSVTGYLVYFCGSLVSWKSKKQATTVRSSTEAEYRAMASTACEIVWVKNLLQELGVNVDLPVDLFCDNNSAIKLAANPIFHDRTKHFEIDVHYIRQKVSSGLIKTVKVKSESQLVDILTKGVSVTQHGYLASKLGLISKMSLWGDVKFITLSNSFLVFSCSHCILLLIFV
ncbi:uncharacterized mitochondrial protein AtMg00810-like [Rutidosis leptorrhynchoides]|uniref:uncharacterized mitochondrial protein AtMg00810-like n=1 Tax=Rutidosis leptorrhynchoides TaxID=125765 RepID=UPI003A99D3D5